MSKNGNGNNVSTNQMFVNYMFPDLSAYNDLPSVSDTVEILQLNEIMPLVRQISYEVSHRQRTLQELA